MIRNFALDDFDEVDDEMVIRNVPRARAHPGRKARQKPQSRQAKEAMRNQLVDELLDLQNFDFTYDASRHERAWIASSLGPFFEQHWIDDVLRLLKGGKEAHVYQCLAHKNVPRLEQPYIAAKVYRPRKFRNLKNDYVYKQGRALLDSDGRLINDSRVARAVEKRTAYGQDVAHTSWIEHEFKTMQLLYEAGADIPVPLESGNNAVLMGYVGSPEAPAPTLNSVKLGRGEARQLFQRVVENIEIMLSNDRVHGDLSAYNILYWEGEIYLIDFPQAFDPHANRNAFQIFERDVQRICDYFTRQGVDRDAHRLAVGIWKAHGYGTRPDIHPALLNHEDEVDRAYWESRLEE